MTAQSLLLRRRRAGRLRRLTTRFARARDGAAAVEFALIAIPFLALLLGILELALVFVLSSSLDNATQMAARTIRTGQLQTAAGTATAFKSTICNNLGWLASDCAASMEVDVQTFATFDEITLEEPIKNGVLDKAALRFLPGGPNDIVRVRIYYQWKLFTPLLPRAATKLSDGKTLIISTLAFRNEPY